MPFKVEIDPASMRAIEELRRRNQRAIKELEVTGRTAVTRMLAFVTGKFAEAWEKEAPRLTGSLAGATTGEVNQGQATGQVFVNPSVVNPVFGGKPSVYGVAVHERKPWVSRVFTTQTPKIVNEGADLIWEAMDEIYKQ